MVRLMEQITLRAVQTDLVEVIAPRVAAGVQPNESLEEYTEFLTWLKGQQSMFWGKSTAYVDDWSNHSLIRMENCRRI